MNKSLLDLNSPESLFVAIILVFGLYGLGELIFKNKFLKNFENKEFHYSLFGIIFISIPIYFSSLYGIKLILLYKIISILLIILGFFQLLKLFKKLNIFLLRKYISKYSFFWLILISLILISFSPATNADSLDYHYGIPFQILNLGYFPNPLNFTWFHGFFAGIIEPTIGLGLYLGSDSFGSTQQLIAILSITGTIINIKKKTSYQEKEINLLLILIFAITPLIFLFSSAKPQLIGVASNLLACKIVFELKKKNIFSNINILIILTLISFSYLVKFTFIISSSLIFLYLFYKCIYLNKIKIFLINSLIVFFFFIFPLLIWKINFLDFSIKEFLIYPIPISKPGMYEFLDYLRGHNEFVFDIGKDNLEKIIYLKIFPIFLFIPSGFEKVTTFIGVPLLFLFLFKKSSKKEIVELRFFIIFLFIAISIFSSPNTRYYLLLYYLGIFHLSLCGINYSNIFYKYLYPVLNFHVFIYLLILSYGVYSLSPGIINNNLREQVLNQNAIYFNVARAVKKKIPENSKIINTFRSTSLFSHNQFRTDWIENLDLKNDKEKVNFYLEKIIDFDPDYLITTSTSNKFKSLSENCIILKYESDYIKVFTRNPFYKDKNIIKFSIYEFNNLKKCLIK